MSRNELQLEVNRIIAHKNSLPRDQQLRYIVAEIAKIGEKRDRDICETLVFGVADAMGGEEKMAAREERRETRSFYSGLALLAVGIVLAFFVSGRTINRLQMFIVQTTVALGAAAFGASIPGFLAISGKINDKAGYHNMTYKATGGLAIFVVVYLLIPSLIR